MNDVHAALSVWGNFYLTTGAAAATLTGLQFVVQSLLASMPTHVVNETDPGSGISAFGTPTVVHFTMALLFSAVLSAPWPGYTGLREALGVIGAGALVYTAIVLRRTRRQEAYVATAYDWFWHIVLPSVAYASVIGAAMMVRADRIVPLFILAGATLLLLCVGIHNAWDTVTYLILTEARRKAASRRKEK
jgi:hypothetical protein